MIPIVAMRCRGRLSAECPSALDTASREGVRAVVIDAAGPAFCAGANIDDFRDGWMESPDPDEIQRSCLNGSPSSIDRWSLRFMVRQWAVAWNSRLRAILS